MKPMKTILFLFLFLPGLPVLLSAQEEIPNKILESFTAKFGKVSNVDWSEYDRVYIASFSNKKDRWISAQFDAQGNWQQTETFLEVEDIPSLQQQYINKNFGQPSYYSSILQLETPEKTTLNISFDTATHYVTLLFSAEGELLDKHMEKISD